MESPESGDRLGVDKLEDALLAVCPLDVPWTGLLVLEELEQELPQVCRRSFSRLPLQWNAIRADLGLPGLLFHL